MGARRNTLAGAELLGDFTYYPSFRLGYILTQNRKNQRFFHWLLEGICRKRVSPVCYLLCVSGSAITILKWSWSSYQATGKFTEKEKFLMVDWVLKQFAPQKAIARQRYIEFVHDGCLNPSSPWEHLRAQVVYGSEPFLHGLRSHLQGQALAEEIPTVQRHAGRLQLTELFNGAAREGKAQKEADIINKAQLEFGTRRSRQPLSLACIIRR
ncbi:hypothetical protein [Desulfosediminicola ganghwensis]|uniref:hypothetical protein n=1 Tax=Desulfosediminicola ganghwensis TaxID=2569540 RepID=UPI0010AD1E90|nr:hypothetical protein [Desulfosediminicola ganghwensis]